MVDYSSLQTAGLIVINTEQVLPAIYFSITLDKKGSYTSECSWAIYQGTESNLGVQVASGGISVDEGDTQTFTMTDPSYAGEYTLETKDSWGDGWNGSIITVSSTDDNGQKYHLITTSGPPSSLATNPYYQALPTSIDIITPKSSVERSELKAMIELGFTIHQLIDGRIYTLLQIKTEFSGNAILLLMTSDYGSLTVQDLLVLGYTIQELLDGGIQLWTQLGQDIDGEASADNSGYSVSLSSDGTIVAIGARYNDGNGNSSGHVRVYEYANSTWSQLGQDIDGEAAWDYAGYSVSLSSDGQIVAIGAPNNDGNGNSSGQVRVYEYANNIWTQLGQDIDGEAASDNAGWSVSLSSDGQIVAIGARYNDGNGNSSGHVRVYQYANNIWTQLGQDIDGEAANDYAGWSVSLSSDGQIVAIGAPYNDGNGNSSGQVRVYQYANNIWTQLGQDIDGEASADNSGYSVSLSSDGTIVAIGAVNNDNDSGPNSGHVRVYEYANNIWTQLGQDIDGEAASDYSGYSVSLSSDGQIVAIGARYNDGSGSNSGHVRVYQYANSTWTQLGQDIDGEAANDYAGWSVSLSSDGQIVAIGAPYNDGNGNSSGQVRVYEYPPPPPPPPPPICFPKGTPVSTNLGPIAIEKLNPDKHTIRGKEIVAITQSRPLQKHIVCFEKDSLSKNVPSQQTLCSMEHKVFYKGEMTKARNLVDLCENVTFVDYNGETLFNVLLKKHDKMMINNLICETLHPENIAAKISTMKDGQKKNKAIRELTKIIKENNVEEYKKLYASL